MIKILIIIIKLQTKEEQEKKKEEEIEIISEKIGELVMTQDYIKHVTSVQRNSKNELEYEQGDLANYCNDLKYKFKNIEKTKADYESVISKLEEDNQKINTTQSQKIEEFTNENKGIKTRLDEKLKIAKTQRNTIKELELKREYILIENEDFRKGYLERELLNKIKFDELEKKYILLQKKIHEAQKNEDVRKVEMHSETKKSLQGKMESDMLAREIEIYEKKNEDLEHAIGNCTVRLTVYENLQKELEKSSKFSRTRFSKEGKTNKSNTNRK
jgi:hypothetical protein